MVPIPRLLGMGFPGTQSFTAIENESLYNRMVWQLHRCLAWLQGNTFAPFFSHQRNGLSDLGYLLIEYVEDGKMLSSSWNQNRYDVRRRMNLYRGLGSIILNLARVPLPRIGSWTINNHGILSLINRPFSDLTLLWSRNSVPTEISQDRTYASADSFVHDMLTAQDERMTHQLNSIFDRDDGVDQLSALVALRALLPRFWDQKSRYGPFVLTLPDLHQSNIFVDDDWNITRIIDLEFAPVQPLQMVQVPSWLSGRGVDQLEGSHLEDYKILFDEFIEVLEQEETSGKHGNRLSHHFRQDWMTGRFWYCLALGSINAFPAVYEQHLRPRFFKSSDTGSLAELWTENVHEFIDNKVKDMQRYEERIRNIFAEAREGKRGEVPSHTYANIP